MIYAINTLDAEYRERVLRSLREGEGRFGYSYDGQPHIPAGRQRFLNGLKKDDYVVYINLPVYGKCTLSRIEKDGCSWKEPQDKDFNYCFAVDKESIFEFDRNDSCVSSLLSSKLKLRGRYWRIYASEDFQKLLNDIKAGHIGQKGRTPEIIIRSFTKEIKPQLQKITEILHKDAPRKELEPIMQRVFQNIPNVENVERKEGRGDKGADLFVTYLSSDVPGLHAEQKVCLVQVKSYEGMHNDASAFEQLKEAYDTYKENYDISCALVISTAEQLGPDAEKRKEEICVELGIPVECLCGGDLSAFVLKYLDLMDYSED